MTDEAIRAMILDLANEFDYDMAKGLKEETAEIPEESEERMAALVKITKKHLKKAK